MQIKKKGLTRILGATLMAALTASLIFFTAPVSADQTEWTTINTPSWEDLVILPASDILDYAVGEDEGDVIYAILELEGDCTEVGYMLFKDGDPLPDDLPIYWGTAGGNADGDIWSTWAIVKSDDGGVTWSDITENVIDASSLPFEAYHIMSLNLVATAPDDEDWVAVAGYFDEDEVDSGLIPNPIHHSGSDVVPFVLASEDGGDNFTWAHYLQDGAENMVTIADMAVSIESGEGIHNIALAGTATVGGNNVSESDYVPTDPTLPSVASAGAVFRLEAGTWLTGGWVDTRCYDGWDGSEEDPCNNGGWSIYSTGIVAVDFSPNFDMDDAIVCMGVGGPVGDTTYYYHYPYLQEGIIEADDGAWNGEAGFGSAPVQITDEGTDLLTFYARYMMGFALPADFDGVDGSANNIYLYVNALNTTSGEAGGFVFISEDCDDLSMKCGPSGDPLLASIDVHGDADSAKAMVGTLGVDVDIVFNPFPGIDTFYVSSPEPCEGVAVWHTVELDDCCPEWECACKDPSGPGIAVVKYTPDGEKEYATTTGSQTFLYDSFDAMGPLQSFLANNDWGFMDWQFAIGNPLDESAFSVSLDDGVSFNQIGLIDTDIDYLSDMAVCPDCSVIYLATINEATTCDCNGVCSCEPEGVYPCGESYIEGWFNCDSIWRSYDNGDTWERINHGDWVEHRGEDEYPNILLRLPCDDLEECCTIYMGIQGTEDLYYSRDCGQCWNAAVNQKLTIQDFAVETENVVYILDEHGMVSTSTQYGRRPGDGVDTDVGSGHSITSCCEGGVVVVAGAANEPVAWSDDGGESWVQTDDLDDSGTVHVACWDCDGDFTLFAATSEGGIYRTTADSGEWDDLGARKYGYYGIALGRSFGTLYAPSNFIHADMTKMPDVCNRFVDPVDSGWGPDYYGYYVVSGVARNLDPCETDCCGTEEWDYLISSLGTRVPPDQEPEEWFDSEPSALRICGCLTTDTYTVLYAIDNYLYDVTDASDGTIWSYEDCAAKLVPPPISPENRAVLECDQCAGCESEPILLKWVRFCGACSYDIEIMDEDGNVIIEIIDENITGSPPTYYLDDYRIECGQTYQWHVRMADTESMDCLHSRWSPTFSFTIKAAQSDSVSLISPEEGATDIMSSNVGFTWTSLSNAQYYTFVLSPNPDLSDAMVSQEVGGTAFHIAGPLGDAKYYYWQVTAWKEGLMLSQSDVGTFSTAPEEVIPPAPEPGEPTVINIPAKEEITPIWIYAMIGIGAALAAVVIVLIVRTRRP